MARWPELSREPVAVPVIDERAVYTLETARRTLGLRTSTLKRELRAGRLRVSRRAGKVWILGAWLLEWLQAGEARCDRPVT